MKFNLLAFGFFLTDDQGLRSVRAIQTHSGTTLDGRSSLADLDSEVHLIPRPDLLNRLTFGLQITQSYCRQTCPQSRIMFRDRIV